MKTETIRRTININNFESLSIEGTGEHTNPTLARLLADNDLLSKAQAELSRIYGVRTHLNTSSEYDKVTWQQIALELQQVQQELNRQGV